jgi:hypothetical protein
MSAIAKLVASAISLRARGLETLAYFSFAQARWELPRVRETNQPENDNARGSDEIQS